MNKFVEVILISMIFPVIGALLIIFEILTIRRKKKLCTEKVQARCSGVERRRSGKGGSTYRPKYEFYYNDVYYSVVTDSASSTRPPVVGEICDLMIDPTDPKYFYEVGRFKKENRMTFILGGFFIIIGVFFMTVSLMTIKA